MTGIRVVPDELVYPRVAGDWSTEPSLAVTPGQVVHVMIGPNASFNWTVPPGVTSINIECFGGGGPGNPVGTYSLKKGQ